VSVLLAIDTSAGASVAVVDADGVGGTVLGVADVADTRSHAEAIGRLISEALAQAGATPADIDGVVAGMGPGPFTGLRVGIAAAYAFAAGRGVPVHPVSSHEAVAHGTSGRVLVVTDARRREVAWSTFLEAEPLDAPHLARPDDLDTVVEGYATYRRIDAAQVSAASLGLRALTLLGRGGPTGPEQPLYLRAPDVTPPKVAR
jgi:tRNA threonylcarbamoyl adenosine modification protein YeaZ